MKKYYNWREEREKYRSNKSQNEEQKSAVLSAEIQEKSLALSEVKKSRKMWIVISCVIALCLCIVTSVILIGKNERVVSEDSTIKLSQMVEKYKDAVGLVVISFENSAGKKIQIPIGTAWAFDQNKFATNAHVAYGLKEGFSAFQEQIVQEIIGQAAVQANCSSIEEFLTSLGQEKAEKVVKAAYVHAESMIKKGVKCLIIINGSQYEQGYTISHVQIHPCYGNANSKFDPDVAIFTIEEKHDTYFPLASQKCLHDLKAGLPIAFLGFPMESLLAGNVNLENPVASMQTGIVVAVSDFEMKDAGGKGNVLIRHNLPAVGGASGSPIFDAQGQVVALLYAGNMIGQVQEGEIKRAPSAALINFGVRSDLLQDMGKPIKIRDFLEK